MATVHDPAPPDLRIARLTSPGGELEARFAPGAGMVGCSLRHRGDELLGILGGLDAYVERGKTFGIPFLYPWANRLGAWGYEVAGRTVVMDPGAGVVRSDPHGLPIHGALARACTWDAAALGADADSAWLDAELDWSAHEHMRAVFPFAHRVALRIALTDTTLRVETTVHATGDDPVPVSFGFHPYLVPPGAPRATWEVELPALTHLALDERGLPTGAREPLPAERFALGERTYDDLFAIEGDTARFAVSDGDRRLVVDFEAGYRYAQVFAPSNNDVICFEPMTAPVDALRTHEGLRVVAPGERETASFALRVD
jgi:galactose mutarotase-like enzyme